MNLVRLFCLLIAFASSTAFAQDQNQDENRDCSEAKSARTLLSQKSALLAKSEIVRNDVHIDVHAEYSAFNLAALKLRTLARFGRCDLHLTEVDETFVVRAGDGALDQFEVSGAAREVDFVEAFFGQRLPSRCAFQLARRSRFDLIRKSQIHFGSEA